MASRTVLMAAGRHVAKVSGLLGHGKSYREGNTPGDPEATGAAILKIVDAEQPPLRVFFGSSGLAMTRAEYARRIDTWEKWNAVSLEAQGDLRARQAK